MELMIEIAKILGGPASVLVVVLVFRKPIAGLIGGKAASEKKMTYHKVGGMALSNSCDCGAASLAEANHHRMASVETAVKGIDDKLNETAGLVVEKLDTIHETTTKISVEQMKQQGTMNLHEHRIKSLEGVGQ